MFHYNYWLSVVAKIPCRRASEGGSYFQHIAKFINLKNIRNS